MAFLAALPIITPIIEKVLGFIDDPAQRAQAAQAALQAQLDAVAASAAQQTDIDKIEAASTSLFVAGWRPFVGWCCGGAFAYQFIVQPLLSWLANLIVVNIGGTVPILPTLDTGQLTTVLLGMLGLGAMRSYDKVQGTASGH
jgi:hypothetical protein